MEADARLRELSLRGGVVLRYGRYRIDSDAIRLQLKPGGIDVDGEARLSFCPCPDPPVALAFRGGSASVEGDITLRFPRLEVFGVPVFALPWLWIRAPGQIGLLPPSFEWRGRDGLRIGSGAHFPWIGAEGAPRVFEATIAGYARGGFAVGGRLETPTSTAKATWDWLDSSRVAIDARGYSDARVSGDAAAAWNVDAIAGDRARAGTVDLGSAAFPYNAGAIETSIRGGEAGRELSLLAATGVIARGWRGEAEAGAGAGAGAEAGAGPTAVLAMGGALTSRGSWDAALDGAVLGDVRGNGALSLAGASLGAEITARPGPLEIRVSSRERVRVATRGETEPSLIAAAGARVELTMPLARSFGGAPGEAPLVHIITPGVGARAAVAVEKGDLFDAVRSVDPAALWVASAGVSTSLGRYTGRALRADVRAGVLGSSDAITHTAAHARAALQGIWLSGDLEAALARKAATAPNSAQPEDEDVDVDSDSARASSGFALLARARLGSTESVSIRIGAAAQLGRGAGIARAIADGSAGAIVPDASLAYLAAEGWSGTAELAIPWSRAVRTIARADIDLTASRLLAAVGAVELVHPCGCFSLVATGAYRVGRDGPDVSLAIDLAPPRPRYGALAGPPP